jgi:hypothetical protein
MFQDLDATLVQLINDAPAPDLQRLRNADVTFVTPDRNFAPGQDTVNLFLYEVRENRELRDPRPLTERTNGSFRRRRAPLRADCSYIVTTWTSGNPGPALVAIEHELLGQALTWLSRFPTIPARYLQGQLGPPAPAPLYPLPVTVAHQDPNQHAGDFWTAMGVSPRPAFYLTVTVELTLGGELTGPLVTTWSTDVVVDGAHERPWVGIGGMVVEQPGGAFVPDAVVDIVDLALRTRTSAEGRYSFPRIPPGGHTVRVVAPGFQEQTQPLVVPGAPDDYLVELTPLP